MAVKFTKRTAWAMMAEIVAAIILCYFLLGGDTWSPATWAVFTIVAAWIVIMNVRREAGLESEMGYLRWKQQLGFLIVVVLLISPLWIDSWWPFVIGLILGLIWLDDYRCLRALRRKYAESPRRS